MHDGQQIIERVQGGDIAAFRTLVEIYQPRVFQFARNMLRSIQDAEDLTQEVFVAAYQHRDRFDPQRANVGTWLLTIARNRCCNQLKRRQVETPGSVDRADHGPRPEQAACQSEAWCSLSQALDSLSLEQRTAFVLAEIQELPHAEIAVIEGIELGTVKSRVSRAKDRLRQVLKNWQPLPDDSVSRPRAPRPSPHPDRGETHESG